MEKNIKYITFIPGGNDTALVIDENYLLRERKEINDLILESDKTIEQVGFISKDKNQCILNMAGGEFCGNATRSAAMYYLDGKPGKIDILVNEKYKLKSGVDSKLNCFCEIPIIKNTNQIKQLEAKIYFVELEGIVFLIIDNELSNEILRSNNNLKEISMNLINKYKLDNYEASGVIFITEEENLSIKPVVYVKNINTLFEETACGSGTASVGIYKSYKEKKSQDLDIYQPSGKIIKVKTEFKEIVDYVEISGKVESNLKIKKLESKRR